MRLASTSRSQAEAREHPRRVRGTTHPACTTAQHLSAASRERRPQPAKAGRHIHGLVGVGPEPVGGCAKEERAKETLWELRLRRAVHEH